MARETNSIYTFNRGLVSRLGLGRIDLKRMALSAETMTNWLPRVLGSMSMRQGFGYKGAVQSNAPARLLPFIFATDDTALLELTDSIMRVWIHDTLITRVAVTSAVTNGTFSVDMAGWTDNDETGCVSSWIAPGYLQMTADGTNAAIRDQQVTVAGTNIGVEHALRIVIPRGPVSLRIGSALGGDGYIRETVLNTGTHSLAFTPTGNFFIRFLSRQIPVVWVDSCTVEAAGIMALPTPWVASDLNAVRTDQSGDVVFVACENRQQRRIERRSSRSWSVVLYLTEDGPFRVQNVTNTSIGSNALTGNVTLTASAPIFRTTHVGGLFSLTSTGQTVAKNISTDNTFSDPIRVFGIGTDRAFTVSISDVFVGTVTLQQSLDSSVGPWTDVAGKAWSAPYTNVFTDGLDNQEAWYRLGIKTGNYTSGTAAVSLVIYTGSITGVVRITDYTSTTVVLGEVLQALGDNFSSTIDWSEGDWSDFRGWPTSVAFDGGRLWWAGKGKMWGSISDAYNSFDPTFVGDAGPISRAIGSGPVDNINWIVSNQRLLVGAQGSELAVRSSALDEPITPTNFNIKPGSSQGSGSVRPVKIDQRTIFVNRSGIKVFQIDVGSSYPSTEFTSTDMTAIVPELGRPGIVRMDVQRQPDTRIHCVRSDGVALIAVSDKNEEVLAWVQVETDGFIEDVAILPALSGDVDDQVYYVVRRTVNGATVRYLEKWAQEVDCRGDQDLCYLSDSYITYSGADTTVIPVPHLEGEQVTVWADGADIGTDDSARPWTQRYTVTGGQITLPVAASNVVVGLPYTAQFKSTKLGMATQDIQSPLNMTKKINHLGLIMANVHSKGITYGPDFDHLDDLPSTINGVDTGSIMITDYDEETGEFPGTWTTDMRLCLQAQSPRPCTVLAATIEAEMHK